VAVEYLELDDNSKEIPNNLLVGLLRMRYPANPDFIEQYASVVRWYVEVETKSATVVREIGLNSQDEPIVLGPFGRNDGIWTGVSCSVGVDLTGSPRIKKRQFEAAWHKFANQ
jgi:hypothetical protein